MECCDFASVTTIIKSYLIENQDIDQETFIYLLFKDYFYSDYSTGYGFFDSSLLCRWFKGQARVTRQITSYYGNEKHQQGWRKSLCKELLPKLTDSAMTVQKLYELVMGDVSISERKKQELTERYPCSNAEEDIDFIARVLYFGMTREFIKKDVQAKSLISGGNLSPVLADFIMGNDVPKPCRYFCGREKELEQLHEMLLEHEKVFLQGIAGVGKSELAKAYAKQHKKNIRMSCI